MFFRDHGVAYALSLAGALGTAGYAATKARRVGPEQTLWWWALAGLTLAQAIGIAAVRQRAQRAGAGIDERRTVR